MVCEFSIEVEARFSLLAILQVFEGVHSGVDDVEPEGGHHAHHEGVKVLEGVVWSVVEPTENLVWSEGVCMVIGVSLDSEKYWGGETVP